MLVLALAAGLADAAPLTLDDVLAGLDRVPLTEAAQAKLESAEGKRLGATGAFDPTVSAAVDWRRDWQVLGAEITAPTTLWGASLISGWTMGTGDIPTYYGERKTGSAGELYGGVKVPLLKGGPIDGARVARRATVLGVDVADRYLAATRLKVRREAEIAYWSWVAAGRDLRLADDLLRIARSRIEAIEAGIEAGSRAPIDAVDNRRIVLERQAKQLDTQRKLASAAAKLSVYLRDEEGRAQQPTVEQLPEASPEPVEPTEVLVEDSAEQAVSQRPEVAAAEAEASVAELELRLARNGRLPKLDLSGKLARDLASSATPPEVQVGVSMSFPTINRAANGKLDASQGEVGRTGAELEWVRDNVRAEVQAAEAAVEASWGRLQAATEAVGLARQLEEAERTRFELGGSDLFRLYLREQSTASAVQQRIDAERAYRVSVATYRAALGR